MKFLTELSNLLPEQDPHLVRAFFMFGLIRPVVGVFTNPHLRQHTQKLLFHVWIGGDTNHGTQQFLLNTYTNGIHIRYSYLRQIQGVN